MQQQVCLSRRCAPLMEGGTAAHWARAGGKAMSSSSSSGGGGGESGERGAGRQQVCDSGLRGESKRPARIQTGTSGRWITAHNRMLWRHSAGTEQPATARVATNLLIFSSWRTAMVLTHRRTGAAQRRTSPPTLALCNDTTLRRRDIAPQNGLFSPGRLWWRGVGLVVGAWAACSRLGGWRTPYEGGREEATERPFPAPLRSPGCVALAALLGYRQPDRPRECETESLSSRPGPTCCVFACVPACWCLCLCRATRDPSNNQTDVPSSSSSNHLFATPTTRATGRGVETDPD
ncbi:hypothetical protein GQ53DRAFT_298190 [Thozetella sp. PMI_491]|nr:hypothetical protein GQ53DRAFT_298190 [Thozetella sp. PMI_491]